MIAQTFLSGCSLSLGVGVTVAFADVPVDGACLLTLNLVRTHTAHPHGLGILHILPARRWSVLDGFQFPLNGSHRPCKSCRILAVLHLAHQGRTLLGIRLGLSGNYVGHAPAYGDVPSRLSGPTRQVCWLHPTPGQDLGVLCILHSQIGHHASHAACSSRVSFASVATSFAPLGLVACRH